MRELGVRYGKRTQGRRLYVHGGRQLRASAGGAERVRMVVARPPARGSIHADSTSTSSAAHPGALRDARLMSEHLGWGLAQYSTEFFHIHVSLLSASPDVQLKAGAPWWRVGRQALDASYVCRKTVDHLQLDRMPHALSHGGTCANFGGSLLGAL